MDELKQYNAIQKNVTEKGVSELFHDVDLSLKDIALQSPQYVYARALAGEGAKLCTTFVEECQASEGRFSKICLSAGVIATQAMDRARLPMFVLPGLATKSLEAYGNGLVTGAIVGGGVLAWNLAIGETLLRSLKIFPQTVNTAIESVSKFSGIHGIAPAKSGAHIVRSDQINIANQNREKSLTTRIFKRIRRGGVALGTGSTVYVAEAALKGDEIREIRKKYIGASVDAGGVSGALVGAMAAGVTKLDAAGMSNASSMIERAASDSRLWAGIAIASIAAEVRSRRKSKQKAIRELESRQISGYSCYKNAETNSHCGPQRTGLFDAISIQAALEDEGTIAVKNENGNISWDHPLIIPIKHNKEYRDDFFAETESFSEVLYLSPYIYASLSELERIKALKFLEGRNTIIEFDCEKADVVGFEELLTRDARFVGIKIQRIHLDDTNTGAVPEVHYLSGKVVRAELSEGSVDFCESAARALLGSGGLRYAEKGISFVSGATLSEYDLSELWNVYDAPFDRLTAHHPGSQKMSKDQFAEVAQSDFSYFAVARNPSTGQMESFVQLIDGIENCDWINSAYCKSKFGNGRSVFLPAIATREGVNTMHAGILTRFVADVVASVSDVDNIYTQCTDVSIRYIPAIMKRFSRDVVDLDMQQFASYEYVAFSLSSSRVGAN